MITCQRTDSDNPDFQKLVIQLDAYLRILDGDDHLFYAQLNKTDSIKHVIVAYQNGEPVGCGAIRKYADDTVEVKRMYVLENQRGKGIASALLNELETWAKELNYKKCILETGKRQSEAVNLYHKNGYNMIENYGKYKNMENSVCFEKVLGK
jgi:putative acetyltransferase